MDAETKRRWRRRALDAQETLIAFSHDASPSSASGLPPRGGTLQAGRSQAALQFAPPRTRSRGGGAAADSATDSTRNSGSALSTARESDESAAAPSGATPDVVVASRRGSAVAGARQGAGAAAAASASRGNGSGNGGEARGTPVRGRVSAVAGAPPAPASADGRDNAAAASAAGDARGFGASVVSAPESSDAQQRSASFDRLNESSSVALPQSPDGESSMSSMPLGARLRESSTVDALTLLEEFDATGVAKGLKSLAIAVLRLLNRHSMDALAREWLSHEHGVTFDQVRARVRLRLGLPPEVC